MKINKSILLVTVVLCSFLFYGCSNSDSNRYVVVSTGGNDGQFPVVLDTKTREIFVITVWDSKAPDIVKKSLDAATK